MTPEEEEQLRASLGMVDLSFQEQALAGLDPAAIAAQQGFVNRGMQGIPVQFPSAPLPRVPGRRLNVGFQTRALAEPVPAPPPGGRFVPGFAAGGSQVGLTAPMPAPPLPGDAQGWQANPNYAPLARGAASPAPAAGQDAIMDVVRQQVEAARATGKAQSAASAAEADQAASLVNQQEIGQLAEEEARIQGEKDVATAHARHAQSVAKFDAAGLKDYWADKSTGQRIGAAIFSALGAFGASLARGPNYAQQIIDAAIKRDTDIQAERIGKLKDQVAMAAAGVKDAQAARATLLADVQARNESAYKTAASRMVADSVRRGIPVEEAKSEERVLGLLAKGTEAAEEAIRLRTQAETQRRLAESRIKGKPRGGRAVGLGAKETKEMKDIRDTTATYNEVRAMLGDLDQSIEKHGIELGIGGFGTDEYERRKSLIARLTTSMKDLQQLGVLSKDDREIIENQIASAYGTGRVKLRQSIDLLDRGQRIFLEKYGHSAQPAKSAAALRPSLSAEDQAAVDWARSSPNDPRAAEILKANGM